MLRGISLWVQHENPLLLAMCSGISRNFIPDFWTRCRSTIRNCVSRKSRLISQTDPEQENGSGVSHGDPPVPAEGPGGKLSSFPEHGREVMI